MNFSSAELNQLRISPDNMKKVLCHYVPNELLPAELTFNDDSFMGHVRQLLDKSNGKLGMFASAFEFAHSFMAYMSFPGSYQYFNANTVEHFQTSPRFFKSMKNKTYMYKTDVCKYFELILTCPLRSFDAKLAMRSVIVYLRKMQSKLSSYSEMVEIPDDSLNTLSLYLSHFNCNFLNTSFAEQSSEDEPDYSTFTLQNFFNCWKEMLELSDDDECGEEVFNLLKHFTENVPMEYNEERYAKIIVWINLTIRRFEEFVQVYIFNFLPSQERVIQKPIVRLFSDKKVNFVMAHELLQSMKNAQLDVSSFEQEVLGMPKLATFSFREVAQKVNKDAMKIIEFIRVSIVISELAATPIPTIDGGHCILASHAFFELLSIMIDSNKIFQIIKKDQWSRIEVFFNSLEQYFHTSNEIYFIDMKDISLIKNEWKNCFKTLSTSSRTPKEVRKVRKNRFTAKDLKNELEYLELNQMFPDITDHVEAVYQTLNKARKDLSLRTSEMYWAIDQCQKACIFAVLPKLSEFLHHQNSCCSVESFKCPHCTGNVESSSIKVNRECTDSIVSKTEKKEAQIVTEPTTEITKTALSHQIEESDSGIASESALETNGEDSDSKKSLPVTKDTSKKSKKVKKQKHSEHDSVSTNVKPEANKSNSCLKCYRTSEFQGEKLRLSKLESKHLKKKLSEVKKEKQEKDEKIRILEENLLAQEKKTHKEKKENEKRIQVLEQLLQAQEQKLAEQNEPITNLKESTDIPSTSSVPDQKVSQRSSEESQKVRVVLYNLLDIQDILHIQNPISKASEITNKLVMKADRENAQLRAEARKEFRRFSHQYNIFVESVDKNLELIRNNQLITVDEIPALPQFPSFSEKFLNAYKKTMKSDAPIICETLLNPSEIQESNPDELDDKECVICIIKIQPADETLKCEECKRRFHNECASKWLEVKRVCPTCRATLLDPNEFPTL